MRQLIIGLAVAVVLVTTVWQVQGEVLLIEDQGGFGNASNVLTSNGFSVTVVNNEYGNNYANLRNAGFLAGFDFIVYGERGGGYGAVLPADVAASLESYIQDGGHLLVTGYDTLGSPTDVNLQNLVRSSTAGDYVNSNPTWVTANINNPILDGPFGDFRNLTFSATGYDDDVMNANTALGAVALAAIGSSGVDRLIFTDLPGAGGSVGYWNGGESGTTTNAQPDFSDGGNPQAIFLNYAAFTAVPEPSTLVLLSMGALGLLLHTRRRR